MSNKTKTTPVYRVENPNIIRESDGVNSHENLKGQWFSASPDKALTYLRKSMQTFGRGAHTVPGAQLIVAQLSDRELDAMKASHNQVAQDMDFEPEDLIVPRDGSVPMDVIPLDAIVGDLAGQLGNYEKSQEANKRIHAAIGDLALRD